MKTAKIISCLAVFAFLTAGAGRVSAQPAEPLQEFLLIHRRGRQSQQQKARGAVQSVYPKFHGRG